MRRLGLKPTLVTYNALMLLCSQVGRTRIMFACCVEPDFDCYGRLLCHAKINGALGRQLEILERLDSLCGDDRDARRDFHTTSTSTALMSLVVAGKVDVAQWMFESRIVGGSERLKK